MATLTATTHISNFTFPRPGTATLSITGFNNINMAIPPGSTWTPGRHWHDDHEEHWKVHSGAMLISINNKSFVVTGGSSLTFARKARHELRRWDCPGLTGHQSAAQEAFRKEMLAKGQSKELEKLSAQEVQAEESTSPADGEKEIFFRNALSAITEPRSGILGEILRFIHTVIIYQGLDAKMVIIDMGPEDGNGWRAMVEEIIWWLLASMANLVGPLFGLKPVNKPYTPDQLISQWEKQKSG